MRARWLGPVLLSLGACAPTYGDGYLEAMAAGKRAQHAGRFGEAAATFHDAAGKATRVKDRDEALLLEARAYERLGKWKRAEATYRQLLARSPNGPRAARAQFELAAIAIEHRDADQGYAQLEAAARAHPSDGLTGRALQRVLAHVSEKKGDAGALAWLDRVRPHFTDTDQQQLLEYLRARVFERAGRTEEAYAAFVETAERHPYPRGPLTDDAWWKASVLAEELGQPQRALAHLRTLLEHREPSETLGSYERPRYAQAQMRIGVLYRDALHDPAAAKAAFHALYTEFPDSILRDDALWAEARILEREGRREEVCDVVSELARELPDSRYAPCANRVCPSAPAPASGRACRDYILRELD